VSQITLFDDFYQLLYDLILSHTRKNWETCLYPLEGIHIIFDLWLTGETGSEFI